MSSDRVLEVDWTLCRKNTNFNLARLALALPPFRVESNEEILAMTIQRVTCPKCRTIANVPAGMSNVRCGSCGSIWNPAAPEQNQLSSNEKKPAGSTKSSSRPSAKTGMIIGGIAGGLAALTIVFLTVRFIIGSSGEPAPATIPAAASSPVPAATRTEAPAVEPYRQIDLPESTRQLIYRDYRKAAGSTVDKRIPIPKDSAVRTALDNTLSQTLDRELTHTALIYDITVEDVQEIIKEGNAKQWK